MKKVLIISYHFPPDAAVGAIRPAKFAKFLPEFGWEPIIYTVKDRYYESCDNSKLEPALKTLKIYRANLIPSPLGIYSRLVGKKNKSLNLPPPVQFVNKTSQGEVSSIKRFISSIVRVPDDKQGWIANIVMDGIRILRKHKIDTFVTSGPPMSTHIGGLLLKIITQTKWLADFRDPWWTVCYAKGPGYHTQLSDGFEKWLEAQVICRADCVISTTTSVTNYFKSIFPPANRNKYFTISNGFDDDDFVELGPNVLRKKSKITITYAGTLYYNRDPEPFFVALSRLINRGIINQDEIEIDLIGNCVYYRDKSVAGLINEYGLSSTVQLLGVMPFDKTLENLMNSDGLLLFAQGQSEQIPSKVFEYLNLNKPILAITGGGETKCILEEFENVFIPDPCNTDEIGEKFIRMLESIKTGRKRLESSNRIMQYNRRYLTKRLADHLDEMNRPDPNYEVGKMGER